MKERVMIRKIVLSFAFLLLLFSCGKSKDNTLAKRMAEMDNPGAPPSESRIDEYQGRIDALEKDTESIIKSVQDLGGLYELLGMKYVDYAMYGPGYDSFSRAIEIYPEKPALHYYRSVCAGFLAQAQDDPDRRINYLLKAESGYKRAIELDKRFSYPYYGLAILYIYEMDRPEEAVPYLESFLSIEKSHVKAMLLLAGLYENYPVGSYGERKEKAAALYENILKISKDDEYRSAARERLENLSE